MEEIKKIITEHSEVVEKFIQIMGGDSLTTEGYQKLTAIRELKRALVFSQGDVKGFFEFIEQQKNTLDPAIYDLITRYIIDKDWDKLYSEYITF